MSLSGPTALIYGAGGQDGSYLADLLVEKNYEVVCVVRRSSIDNTSRLHHLQGKVKIIEGDITDSGSVFNALNTYKPNEIYNLAAQSHVATSFEQPYATFQINTVGELNVLEGMRTITPNARHYFAGTSEQFGNSFTSIPNECRFQDEDTPFNPASPYAVAKVASHNLVKSYRESYGLHASVGILFNHESPRRGDNFVTKKITNWIQDFEVWLEANGHFNGEDDILLDDDFIISNITENKFPKLRLGNINAFRDWGFAGDYVRAMWLMLQQDVPDDYVVATGETYTVRDFLREAFAYVDINDFEPFIVIDPKFYRPNDVHFLCGRPNKVMRELGWFCEVSFQELVKLMIKGDNYGQKTSTAQEVYET